MGPIGGFHVVGELPSGDGERARRSARHPDGRAAQVVLGGPDLLREAASLPRGGAWAELIWGRGRHGAWVLIPEDRQIALPTLRHNAQPSVAFAIGQLLLEALEPLHEQAGWHGRLDPSGIGFDLEGRLRILPSLHGERIADPSGEAPSPALDCWLVASIMIYLLGQDFPAAAGVPSGLSLEGMDDARGRLLLGGLCRTRPLFRLTPAKAARQALVAVFQGRADAEEDLKELLDLAGLGQTLRHTGDVTLPPRTGRGVALLGSFHGGLDPISPIEPDDGIDERPMQLRRAIVIPDFDAPRPVSNGAGDLGELDGEYEFAADIEDEISDVVTRADLGPARVEAEPDPEPEPEAVVEPEPEPEPEPVVEPEPEPVVEPEPEPVVASELDQEAEPEPLVEPEAEPVAEAKPVVEPEAEPVAEAEPVVEPGPEEAPEPEEGHEHEHVQELENEEGHEHEHVQELEPIPTEPEPEPIPVEPEPIPVEPEPKPIPAAPEPEPEPEPVAPPPLVEAVTAEAALVLETADATHALPDADAALAVSLALSHDEAPPPLLPPLPDPATPVVPVAEPGLQVTPAESGSTDPPAVVVPATADPPPPRPGQAPGSILSREARSDLGLPGSIGVTNDTSREAELGAGKWTETGARSFEELAKSLPNTPIRELTIEGGGPPWGRILFVAALVFLAVAWWSSRPPEPVHNPAPAASQRPPQTLPTRVKAAAAGAQVTVTTEPPGALLTLDDQTVGRAPIGVPVPDDAEPHQLCAVKDTLNACRTLTAEQLLAEDPYLLDLTAAP